MKPLPFYTDIKPGEWKFAPGFEPGASTIAFTRLDHKTMSSYVKSGGWQCGSNEDRLGNGLGIFSIFCLSTEAMIN